MGQHAPLTIFLTKAETWAFQVKRSHHRVPLCLGPGLLAIEPAQWFSLEGRTQNVGRGEFRWATFLTPGLHLLSPSLLNPRLGFQVWDAWFTFPRLYLSFFSAFPFLLKHPVQGSTTKRQNMASNNCLQQLGPQASGVSISGEGVLLVQFLEENTDQQGGGSVPCLLSDCRWGGGHSPSHTCVKKPEFTASTF